MADPDLQIRGRAHPDQEIREGAHNEQEHFGNPIQMVPLNIRKFLLLMGLFHSSQIQNKLNTCLPLKV